MDINKLATDRLIEFADQWDRGEPFDDNADLESIYGAVHKVYEKCGFPWSEATMISESIGITLAAWKSSQPPGNMTNALRGMAEGFRMLAERKIVGIGQPNG